MRVPTLIQHSRGQVAVSALLPTPPNDEEKLSYCARERAYLTLLIIVGTASFDGSQFLLEFRYALWFLVPYTVFSVVYIVLSLIANYTGPNFKYAVHEACVRSWLPENYPAVDIHLPICGEPIDILRNAWSHVFELIQAYPGHAQAYVLDDGDEEKARILAADFGFTHIVRENRGWMKKAGNLRNAFDQTQGEFILLLDADFTPRPDFLAETLPYFDDPGVAIVQTPQFFRTLPEQTWVERSAGAIQEMFYRFIQVSRDTHAASICVGTCAVYRRKALEANGGPTLIDHSEDVHTGFDLQAAGWKMRYVPISLAAGICPSNSVSFLTQQYRWCDGSMSFLGSRKFWATKMSAMSRLCFISGFYYYIFTAVEMLVSPLIPSLLLILIPGAIKPIDYVSLLPALVAGMVLYPLWHRCSYGPSTWSIAIIRSWAHTLALWDTLRGRHMGWQVTGSSGRKSQMRRFWVGLSVWSGGAALAWLGLAAWRIVQYGPGRFWVITVFGLLYAGIIIQVLCSYERKV
jgi:cellulose synthase (UDP-forming)